MRAFSAQKISFARLMHYHIIGAMAQFKRLLKVKYYDRTNSLLFLCFLSIYLVFVRYYEILKMISPAVEKAASMSTTIASPYRSGRSNGRREQRKRTIGVCTIYLLAACSAVLLIRSYQLQGYRFGTSLNDLVTQTMVRRILPEEGMDTKTSNNSNNINNDDFNGISEYFVPSLDFRIRGISQYNTDGIDFLAHIYCQEDAKELLWEWFRGRDNEQINEESQLRRSLRKEAEERIESDVERTMISTTTNGTSKRLLIGVAGGYDDRARLLERAVWSARVYATTWSNVDVVTLQGTAFSPHGCKAPAKHSTINKVRLLFKVLDLSSQRYDRLLILDADTMMYDMDVDITALTSLGGDANDDDNYSNNFVVAGVSIQKDDEDVLPWKISSSVMLWNLEHPLTPSVALEWFNFSKDAIVRGTYVSDQRYLHKSLQKFYDNESKTNIIRTFPRNIFDDDESEKGIVQFILPAKEKATSNTQNYNNSRRHQLDDTLARMEKISRKICGRHKNECEKVGAPPRYEVS